MRDERLETGDTKVWIVNSNGGFCFAGESSIIREKITAMNIKH